MGRYSQQILIFEGDCYSPSRLAVYKHIRAEALDVMFHIARKHGSDPVVTRNLLVLKAFSNASIDWHHPLQTIEKFNHIIGTIYLFCDESELKWIAEAYNKIREEK